MKVTRLNPVRVKEPISDKSDSKHNHHEIKQRPAWPKLSGLQLFEGFWLQFLCLICLFHDLVFQSQSEEKYFKSEAGAMMTLVFKNQIKEWFKAELQWVDEKWKNMSSLFFSMGSWRPHLCRGFLTIQVTWELHPSPLWSPSCHFPVVVFTPQVETLS